MGFEQVIDRYGQSIDADLAKILSDATNDALAYHPVIGRIYDSLTEYSMRKGRRLASCSTLVTYEGYAGKIDDRIVRVGSAIELYRHAILVHDDLVDADLVRRGGRTFHRLMESGYDERFGSGAAIFAGNMMFSLALETLLSSGFNAELLTGSAAMLATEYRAVNESQVLDLAFEYGEPDVSEWNVMASKRATTLFRATLGIGAMLAGAPETDLKTLSEAGEHIGYAFDIQDDIIDTYASAEQYGRVPGADILRGKKPLHIVLTIRRDDQFAAALRDVRAGKTNLDIEQVRKAVSSSGALDEAKRISRDHADAGSRLISQTGMRDESKQFFISFIDYVKESLDWYR